MTGSTGERIDAAVTTDSGPAGRAVSPAPAATLASPARQAASTGALADRLGAVDPATRAQMVHALQRSHGNASVQRLATLMSGDRPRLDRAPRRMVARTVTFDDCSSTQKAQLTKAHRRANSMINNAIEKLDRYDGTIPSEVKTALDKHFNSTRVWVARLVSLNLSGLKFEMSISFDPQYECQGKQESTYLAWVPWCVPLADIEIYPLFFDETLNSQAGTLVHEWFHKYSCKLDIHYDHEKAYEDDPTIAQILNADSFGELVEDLW